MRLLLITIATAFTSVLSGCGLMGKGKVEPVVRRGAPFDALDSQTDIERVELIVPPGNSYVNRTTASNLTVSGICISGSAAVYISLVSTDISQTVACDGSTGAFSSVLDLGTIPDGIVTISIAFLRNLVSTTPIYVTQRNIAKDTDGLPAFTIPSTLSESSGFVRINSVEGADSYRTTFTPVGGGPAIGPVESTTVSIPVAALAAGTTYTVSVVALDAAGNATASSNTGTFTRAGPVNFTILATLNSNLPAGVTSVDFFTTTGASSKYCSPGFTYCNPNETAFRDSVTVTMTPGRTITVGSNLTGSDMYLIGLVNPAGVSCEPNVGSPRNFAYVTGNATIDIICRLDPPDPTGFTATAASSTQMNLSWTSGAGTTNGYRIAYKAGIVAPADCNTSGAGITLIAEGDITGTSHQVTGLTTTETYSFRLCSINSDPTPAQSAGVTATGTTAAFLGSASAKGKHIYASWSNGISPYVASIYSDNACTNLMKSTGSTVEVEALFAEFSFPGTYYFKAVDSQSHATSCQSVSLSAAGTEGVSITIVGVDSSSFVWDISGQAFGNVLWQFDGWNCNLGAGKKILTSTENGGGWTGSVEGLAFGTIYSFLVTPDSGNDFSPCASPKTSDTFLVQNIYLHDSWAAVKLGGIGTLDVGLYAGTDTSCAGTALFTKSNLSAGDYVGLSTTASALTADAIYNLRVHDGGYNSDTSCDVIRTRSWVPTFTVSASNIVANTSVDLTWSGASGGLYTLLRFNASNSNRCDGPGVPVYSGASSAMRTDAVLTGTYHYRVIGGAGPGYPEVSNCLQVVVP